MNMRLLAGAMVFMSIYHGLAARGEWALVDLSAYANARIQNYQPSASGYPEGQVTLGGVPFNIQLAGGNNAWNAEVVSGPYPHILDIPINVAHAIEVHTLINTFYGQPGPNSYVTLEFFGSNGAYYSKNLIGDVDVRDHFYANWTNTINNTTTTNVYTSGGGQGQESRLDKQQIILPESFLDQVLSSMRLTSTGGVLVSDASIQGLTVRYEIPLIEIAASHFDSGSDGWFLAGDPTSPLPTWQTTGGNPGGCIRATDAAENVGVWFHAPPEYLGNQLAAYGGSLRFDLQQNPIGGQYDVADVRLIGAGLILVIDAGPNPAVTPAWTSYAVTLTESSGWHVGSLSGPSPTYEQFSAVLSDLSSLQIRGEFGDGADVVRLDNVSLLGSACTSAADIDGDGSVNLHDFQILQSVFGQSCP